MIDRRYYRCFLDGELENMDDPCNSVRNMDLHQICSGLRTDRYQHARFRIDRETRIRNVFQTVFENVPDIDILGRHVEGESIRSNDGRVRRDRDPGRRIIDIQNGDGEVQNIGGIGQIGNLHLYRMCTDVMVPGCSGESIITEIQPCGSGQQFPRKGISHIHIGSIQQILEQLILDCVENSNFIYHRRIIDVEHLEIEIGPIHSSEDVGDRNVNGIHSHIIICRKTFQGPGPVIHAQPGSICRYGPVQSLERFIHIICRVLNEIELVLLGNIDIIRDYYRIVIRIEHFESKIPGRDTLSFIADGYIDPVMTHIVIYRQSGYGAVGLIHRQPFGIGAYLPFVNQIHGIGIHRCEIEPEFRILVGRSDLFGDDPGVMILLPLEEGVRPVLDLVPDRIEIPAFKGPILKKQ